MEPVQTEWTDSTVAVRQDLTGRDVKQETTSITLHEQILLISSPNRINLTNKDFAL